MSLIDELKRRNVFKVAGAYLALGWVVVQATATLAPVFHLPDSALPLVTWIGVIGFPFVVVFSWVYELTPEGMKRESEIDRSQSITHLTGKRLDYIIIALLVVAIGLFVLQYLRPPVAGSAVEAPAAAGAPAVASNETDAALAVAAPVQPAAPAADEKSIAVLPFENRSDQSKDAYFVDGIHDDILTQLSKVSALKVISRTSVEQFRATRLPIATIAAQLGVRSILEGGVQRAGDRVRINVQLIDASTDAHLWAETYDRELSADNIFAIQSEVAAAIVGALQATLTPAEQARAKVAPTRNLEAWEAYQLGQQRLARRTSAALLEAEAFFQRSIDLDPKFARAYAALANSIALQVTYADVPRGPTLERAQQAADAAMKLDPELSEAWAAAGLIASDREQFTVAEQLLRRATELDPNNSMAFMWRGQVLQTALRYDEAVLSMRTAAELDPLSAIIQLNLGGALEGTARFAEAAAHYRRAIEIDPTFPGAYGNLGFLMAYALNRYAEAVPLLQKAVELDPDGPRSSGALALLHLDLGNESLFLATAEQAARRWPGDAQSQLLLAVAALRQDPAGALRHAQQALGLFPRNPGALVILRDLDLQSGRDEEALARYQSAYPELFVPGAPSLDASNYGVALDLALVLQQRGDTARVNLLLDAVAQLIGKLPRMGGGGYWITDVQLHALRGQPRAALAALAEAKNAGWRSFWRYHRDLDPSLAVIRDEPEFKAIFADIEGDMARQRVELAARPANAPLNLGPVD